MCSDCGLVSCDPGCEIIRHKYDLKAIDGFVSLDDVWLGPVDVMGTIVEMLSPAKDSLWYNVSVKIGGGEIEKLKGHLMPCYLDMKALFPYELVPNFRRDKSSFFLKCRYAPKKI